jgi:hypothetical protein
MASSGGPINSTETTLEMNGSGFHKGFLLMKKKMAYKKPQLIATNNPTGSFAAGCLAGSYGGDYCRYCDRAK